MPPFERNTAGIVIPSEELHCRMNPMDFEEFLWATGRESLMDGCAESFLFWDRDVKVENGVTYLPLYMLPLL